MKSSTMQYFKSSLYVFLVVSVCSCSSLHYTNYGRPFDFLKAERVVFKTKAPKNDNSNLNLNNRELNKISYNNKEMESVDIKLESRHDSFQAVKNLNINNNIAPINKSKKSNLTQHKQNKLVNILAQKMEKKIQKQWTKTSATTSFQKQDEVSNNEEITDFVLLLLCLIFPPVAVWFVFGTERELWLDLMCYLPFFIFRRFGFDLFILFILPVLYAIYVIFLK